MEWKLTIENGQLKLHTQISSIEELIMFNQASLRYLSPFNGLVKITPFQFQKKSMSTLVYASCRLFLRAITPQVYVLPSPGSMPFALSEMRPFMDKLIHSYLKISNPKLPFLFAPAFLEHYNGLSDPFSCPITLAICAHTLCMSRDVLHIYSAAERRRIAEFFYVKSKDILDDIFDDPSRKLETIFTISFLNHFLTFVLLQPQESRRWITISYLLCKELEPMYLELPEPSVESILLQRHSLYATRMLKLTDLIMDGAPDLPWPKIMFSEKIPGEDEETCMYIDMYNHLLEISNNPCIHHVIAFTENPVTAISLAMIFESDSIIRRWWNNLPPHFRLCDVFCGKEAEAALKQNTSFAKCLVFAYAHYNMLQINACLINPKLLSDEQVQGNTGILEKLSERAVSTGIQSCHLLLSAILQMVTGPEQDLSPLTFEFLSCAFNTLTAIACCPNAKVPKSLQRKSFEGARAIHARMPSDNQIPPSLSPLKAFIQTREQEYLSVYRRYPMPGLALVVDMFSMSYTDLESHLHVEKEFSLAPMDSNSIIKAVSCTDYIK
ncbi:hypothetical protein BJV82DRAFT_307055 [Fennellomyces sp. T-0311]|nr:hypothetical protein BJV82DRAFT_307055 [Fennellomyces sp. T-0311]